MSRRRISCTFILFSQWCLFHLYELTNHYVSRSRITTTVYRVRARVERIGLGRADHEWRTRVSRVRTEGSFQCCVTWAA